MKFSLVIFNHLHVSSFSVYIITHLVLLDKQIELL